MKNRKLNVPQRFWKKLPPTLAVTALTALGIVAYSYSAVVADIGDTYVGPPLAQEALRAFIIAQILRAFVQRWSEFTTSQRWGWGLVAAGLIFNLARGHFGGVSLTFSFALSNLGLVVITYRLMTVTPRERRLARSLFESEQIRLQQDEVIADLHADLSRVGQQSKEFEIRARNAERRLAELGET